MFLWMGQRQSGRAAVSLARSSCSSREAAQRFRIELQGSVASLRAVESSAFKKVGRGYFQLRQMRRYQT